MRIPKNPKETIEAIEWYWDAVEQKIKLNEERRIKISFRNSFFAEHLEVISGYKTAEDALGKLFYSRSMYRAGAPATFLLLKSGRIWFINRSETGSMSYEDLLCKIVKNPDAISALGNVDSVKAAADLFLHG